MSSQRSCDRLGPIRDLDITEAAHWLGVSPHTLRCWADGGYLRCFRTPTGERRFSRAELDRTAYIAQEENVMTADPWISDDEIRPLTAGDISQAAAVVGQMAAIPALQGGHTDFDALLKCTGWSYGGDNMFAILVSPDDSREDRETRVRAAIQAEVEDCRRAGCADDDEYDPDERVEIAHMGEILAMSEL